MAIAVGDRSGEVRYFGEIDNTPEATRKLVMKLASKYGCYEAGPTAAAFAPQPAPREAKIAPTDDRG